MRAVQSFLQSAGYQVNRERLLSYLTPFTTTVRHAGTPDERAAFDFAARVLQDSGYSVRLLHHPAYISFPRSAGLKIEDLQIEAITHSMAKSVPDGISAPLALHDDADVEGKIVVQHGIASPAAVKRIRERGAHGAIFINTEHCYEMVVSPVWGSPTLDDLPRLPDIPVISVTNSHAPRLLDAAKRNAVATVTTVVETSWIQVPLIEATITPISPELDDGSLVLFSGHVDAWHLGAMDNGGANATMLEVAVVMAQHRDALRRSLRFLFWSGHSQGRYAGSTWYADNHFAELRERALIHINIDSVGGKGATVLSEAACMAQTRDFIAQVVAYRTGQPFNGARIERAGDQSFVGHGVSSALMGLSEQPASDSLTATSFGALFGGRAGGFGWWWHTPHDTIDKIDPDNLERDAQIYLDVTALACCLPVPPLRFSAAAAELHQFLKQYGEIAGPAFDLTTTIGLAEEVIDAVTRFEQAVENGSATRDAWRIMKQLGNALIPLNYVAGTVYEHDPALPQRPMPVLRDIEQLAKATTEDKRHHLRVGLVRKRNYVEDMLRQALRAVANFR